jgi:uncharacterized protein (TIGR02246 family)
LLDLGCGPGSLSLLLASSFDDVLAVDADADMIRVGQAAAAARGIRNVTWRHEYAEDLDDVGRLRVVTLAQSFHWMDRPVVAAKIRGWLQKDGCCVHVGATTHEGTGATGHSPYPAPPRDGIRQLVQAYLGPERRAGQGVVVGGYTPEDEKVVFRAAGFAGPDVVLVAGGDLFERSEDQVIASVLSLSSSAPHLFGERLPAFLHDLRQMLREASPSRMFAEQLQDMRLFLWRVPMRCSPRRPGTIRSMSEAVEDGVRSLYHEILAGWNGDDAQAFAAPFADDGVVIGFDGSEIVGRTAIAEAMAAIFADHATGSYVGIVRSVRPLGPGIALLRAISGVVPAGERDLKPELNAVQALIAQRGDSGWRVLLYQNTPAAFHGRPEAREAMTEELREALPARPHQSGLEADLDGTNHVA